MIHKAWQKYRAKVMPAGAGPIQVEETRRSFYAGAWAVFGCFMDLDATDDNEATPADLVQLDRLKAELEEYAASMREGPMQ